MSGAVAIWRPGEPLAPLREVLARDGALAVPTESSYALAADPRSGAGVELVFRIKRRPATKPLPVIAADREQIRALGGSLEEADESGLTALWPGPLTLLLPLERALPAAAGRPSCGFRIPAHAPLRRLLAALGHGLTATSANLSGRPPILDPAALAPLLIRWDVVIVDGGCLPGGAPSTVVELVGRRPRILRPGALAAENLRAAVRKARDNCRDRETR